MSSITFTPPRSAPVRYVYLSQSCTIDVLSVRKLYAAGKYKRCATLCEELQHGATHPVHKASLDYYRAICHECIASSVHKFSSSKIPMLLAAKESLQSALWQMELLQYRETSMSTPESDSSILRLEESSPVEINTTLDSDSSPCARRAIPSIENQVGSDSVNADQVAHIIKIVTSSDRSLEDDQDSRMVQSSPSPRTPTLGRSVKRRTRSKARLSESLSSSHILVEDLVPSPLHAAHGIKFKQSSSCYKPLPRPPTNLDMPSPRQSIRSINIPTRESNVESLIAKFESSPGTPESPLTLRFTRIGRAFEVKSGIAQSTKLVAASSLIDYNNRLASFREHIIYHIKSVEECIAGVELEQQHHRNQRDTRLASFWSFDQIVKYSNNSDCFAKAKADRLVKLRDLDWVVSKERHGWKGQNYYESLRQKAAADLK